MTSPRKSALQTLSLPPLASLALTAGLALGLTMSGGCEEKKPAPKVVEEAPPPPPPPPPVLSFDALSQQLKIDPRVQVSAKVSSTDEALSKAALQLANAIAKGDANALKPLLTRRAQDALEGLTSTDAWKDSTRGIEAVRVIALGPPSANMIINPNAPASSASSAAARQLIDQALEGVTRGMKPEDAARERDLFERRIRAEAERTLARNAATGGAGEAAPAEGTEPAEGDKRLDSLVLELLQAEAGNQRANQIFNQGTSAVLLLAVQDERGAYLMGWQIARDASAIKFDIAPSSERIVRRASEFDEVGMKGFEIAPPPRFAAGAVPTPGAKGEPTAAPKSSGGGTGG